MLKKNAGKKSSDKKKLALKMVKLSENDETLVYGLRGDYQ